MSVACAHNGRGDGRMMQGPRDRNFAREAAPAARDFLYTINQRKITREVRLGEVGMSLAPVVVGKVGDMFASHGPGEQTGGHRRVNDHPDSFTLAMRKNIALDLAMKQRVRGLGGSDGGNRNPPPSCCRLKLETPIQRTFPSCFRFDSVAQPSSRTVESGS